MNNQWTPMHCSWCEEETQLYRFVQIWLCEACCIEAQRSDEDGEE